MTAARLAASAGITENAIRKIESGDSAEPRFTTGLRIAQALAVSPLELAGAAVTSGSPDLALTIRSIRLLRPALEAEGVEHLDIFGSVARGNAKPTSDIDVIVTPKPDVRFSLLNLSGVALKLEEQLGRKCDVLTLNAIKGGTFAQDILSESVRVF